jgi:hypothetical protein
MTDTIKVRYTVTVELDRNEWAAHYGMDDRPSQVRADVRRYLDHIMCLHPVPMRVLSSNSGD